MSRDSRIRGVGDVTERVRSRAGTPARLPHGPSRPSTASQRNARPDEQAREEMMRRRRRTVLISLLAAAGLLVTVDFVRGVGQMEASPAAMVRASSAPTAGAQPSPANTVLGALSAPPVASGITFARTGPGTFSFAAKDGPVLGKDGPLRQFRVAVEEDSGQDPDVFAAEVDKFLGDPRSWTASGELRLQRVANGGEFTVYLATETTSEQMCREDGLQTDKYTSCRIASGKVVINLTRWVTSVPDYGAPLETYRGYAINHEVGHQLGYAHERCPTAGGPAPVMQQQTLGLYGCVANAWPYLDGRRFTGPPGAYVAGN